MIIYVSYLATVGMGIGMATNAAIDSKDGGYGATADLQGGFSDSTTKSYNGLVGNSLLFGGSVNLVHGSTGSANIDKATDIKANNINQNAQTNESALYQHTHQKVDPNWTNLMINGVVTGFISGVTVAGSKVLLNAGKVAAEVRDIAMLSDLMDSINPNTVFSKPIGALVRLYDIDSVIKSAFSPLPLYPNPEFAVRASLEGSLTLPHSNNN